MTYLVHEHTEQKPRIENAIKHIRSRYTMGQSRDEIHNDLVPLHLTEEEFFLYFIAAVLLEG